MIAKFLLFCVMGLTIDGCVARVDVGNVTDASAGGSSASDPSSETLSFGLGTHYKESCALFADHEVRCWNAREPATFHRVGMFSGAEKFAATDYGQTCIITTGGALQCTSYNTTGFDVAEFTGPLSSVPIPNPVVDVTLSYWGGCALTDEGRVYCWGKGLPDPCNATHYGAHLPLPQLSTADIVEVKYPRPVVKVRHQQEHTCAIVDDGRVFCHGMPGTTDTYSDAYPLTCRGPSEVPDIGDAVDLALAAVTTCVVRSSGRVTCLGSSELIGLGLESGGFARGDVPGIKDAVSIEASPLATCILTSVGQLKCWGDDQCGSLAASWSCQTTQVLSYPFTVHPEETFQLVGMTDDQTCGVTSAGKALCWGVGEKTNAAEPSVYRPY